MNKINSRYRGHARECVFVSAIAEWGTRRDMSLKIIS